MWIVAVMLRARFDAYVIVPGNKTDRTWLGRYWTRILYGRTFRLNGTTVYVVFSSLLTGLLL